MPGQTLPKFQQSLNLLLQAVGVTTMPGVGTPKMTPPIDGRAVDQLVRLLESNGVDYIFFHPFSSVGSILDGLVDSKVKPILHLHEFTTMSTADGYAAVSGKPAVVILGDAVGQMAGHGGYFDSSENQRSIVVLASRYPIDSRLKNNHDSRDIGGLVREWLRWDYEVIRKDQILPIVEQAFRISMTEPRGPTLVIFNHDHLLEPLENQPLPSPTKFQTASPPQMSDSLRTEVAKILVESTRPYILTAFLGRNPQAVHRLVELAELLALPVIESSAAGARPVMNFPMDNPLHLGFGEYMSDGGWTSKYFVDSDVIFAIDCDLPAGVSSGTKVIHMDVDQAKGRRFPYPANIRINANSNVELSLLTREVKSILRNNSSAMQKLQERRAFAKRQHELAEGEWDDELKRTFDDSPISPWRLSYELDSAKDRNTIVVFDGGANFIFQSGIRMNEPGSWISNYGGFLGWGVGAGLGVAVGAPERKVVSLIGDGTFVSGNGPGALWTAAHYSIPVMWLIDNNQEYAITKYNLLAINGKAAHTGKTIGQDMKEPVIEFTDYARACNVFSKKVEDPSLLKDALKEGFEKIETGRPALLDVRTRSLVEYGRR